MAGVGRGAAGALAAGALALLAGCGSATAGRAPTVTDLNGDAGRFAGAEISPAFSPPAGTFAASTGAAAYDLAAQLKGHVTLVYFGYTRCPDVCPTTMADLGAALRSLPAATADQVRVDFVTSDPADDTPAVMKTWLAHFDAGLARPFVGLTTGTDGLKAVQAYAAEVGVELEDPTTDAAGTTTDQHAAQVLAFSPDGRSHLVWTPGTTQAQYAGDITKLVAGRT